MDWQASISGWIAESSVRETVLYLLMNVPGLPPIVQTVHIAAIAVVMASVVFIALRVLNIALPGQQPQEMVKRLMPWFWWALPVLFLSGIVFVIARPDRYLYNPIAGWKVLFIVIAVTTALVLQRRAHKLERRSAQALALILLSAIVGVVLAGRWIAYVDYIYWE